MIEGLGITLCADKGCVIQEGFSQPYLRCLILDEVDYVMREVHKGCVGTTQGHDRSSISSYQ